MQLFEKISIIINVYLEPHILPTSLLLLKLSMKNFLRVLINTYFPIKPSAWTFWHNRLLNVVGKRIWRSWVGLIWNCRQIFWKCCFRQAFFKSWLHTLLGINSQNTWRRVSRWLGCGKQLPNNFPQKSPGQKDQV